MKSAFNMTGLDDYLQRLQDAEIDINKVSREALSKIGDALLADMKSRVPVSSGNLRDHIRIKTPTAEGDYNYISVGIIYDLAYTDRETSIQARAVEFGSVNMAAQPFIRPAIRSKRGYILDLIRNSLKDAGLVD